jgi:hydroxymethylpyrimidine/phosphomethylpyrimidine kinase
VIAEISTDYPDIPIISYMPDLSWWDSDQMEQYLDAFQELLLPQTSVLVGNHNTLWRWLLPDWEHSRPPTARDLAMAAQEGCAFVLVTGIPLPGQFVDNVLSSPRPCWAAASTSCLTAASSAPVTPCRPHWPPCWPPATTWAPRPKALEYLDRCLDQAFAPAWAISARPHVLGPARRR